MHMSNAHGYNKILLYNTCGPNAQMWPSRNYAKHYGNVFTHKSHKHCHYYHFTMVSVYSSD